MIIIDFILRAFYVIAKGKGIRKLDNAITGANVLFMLNFIAIFNWSIGVVTRLMNIHIYPSDGTINEENSSCLTFLYGAVIVIFGFAQLRLLGKLYLNKTAYYRVMRIKITPFVAISFLIVYYLCSVFLSVYSFRAMTWYD